MKAILLTTAHKGVWYAEVEDGYDLTQRTFTGLKNARCAIYFGTTGGIQQLASTGPTKDSRIGHKADIEVLHDITAVWAVTETARLAWTK